MEKISVSLPTILTSSLIIFGIIVLIGAQLSHLNPEIVGEEIIRTSIMSVGKIVIVCFGASAALFGILWWFTMMELEEIRKEINNTKKQD